MKRIAIFQKDLAVGGVQKSLINLLNKLDYKKVQVDCYLINDINFHSSEIPKEVNIHKLKKLPKFLEVLPFSILKFFYRFNKRIKYDLAIDYNSYKNETAIAALKANSEKTYIMHHDQSIERMKYDFKYKFNFNKNKAKYKHFDNIIFVSSDARDEFNQLMNTNKGIVLPNIINEEEIKELEDEEINFRVDKNYINLVSMGNFNKSKGFDILVEKIKNLKRKDIRLYIIGSGEDFMKIDDLIKSYGLEDKVFLLGRLSNPFPYFKQMDYYISTSRYEGFGMTFLEARVVGLPVLIPKHLEKKENPVKAVDDIDYELENLKRVKKERIDLSKYNENILKRFYEII